MPLRRPARTATWLLAAAGAIAGAAFAQGTLPAASAPRSTGGAVALPVAGGPTWSSLTAQQRAALAPLQRDWVTIGAPQKRKWLELATRFPSMPAEEQVRVQERMADWAHLTPQERGRARLRYQQAQRVAPEDRQERWEAYQALPPDQRRQLATRSLDTARRPDARGGRDAVQGKSNLVPNPSYAAAPKPVAPIVVQAKPGASTTLMSRRPVPPPHQQIGMPKIVATPNFVDRTTLLPQRGPQGAATRSPDPAAAPTPPAHVPAREPAE